MSKKCIYCDLDNDLSKSDVIPDALTNAKIINPNVCRVEHNNKFSDLFEDEVISKLAFVTNELDIKSSKSKNYARYIAEVNIDGTKYKSKITTDAGIFKKKKMRSLDGKQLLGPLEDIMKIRNAKDDNVTVIDVNDLIIEKKVGIDLEVFFSKAMFRLAAKIAFEWYCVRNDICKKIDDFDPVIQYITNGTENNIVTLVSQDRVYNLIDESTEFGSHTLLTYIANDNSINVLVSLFGIAIYNVKVCKSTITECKNNILFQELRLDSKRNEFVFDTYESMEAYFISSFTKLDTENISLMVPKDMTDLTLRYKSSYYLNYSLLQSNLKLTNKPNSKIIDLLIKRLNIILQTSALTIRGLKRFVKEHFSSFDEEIKLNPKGTHKKAVFMFYQLFIIGQSNGTIRNFNELTKEIRKKFSGEDIVMNEAISTKLNDEIFSVDNHSKLILEGAKSVDSWDF